MVVIVVGVCPPALRGDLTQWLFEVSTGVYAGNVSARVRDKLWERVCENIKNGRATMVFGTNNEQRMDFRVHGAKLEPVDFDGLKLMLHPAEHNNTAVRVEYTPGFSNAAKYMLARKYARPRKKTVAAQNESFEEPQDPTKDYSVVDVETTGLSPEQSRIMEICVLKVRQNRIEREYRAYVRQPNPVPDKIARLTGITDDLLAKEGVSQKEAVENALALIGDDIVVAHNAKFDFAFVKAACKKEGLPLPQNQLCDTLTMARERVRGVPNYRLSTLAEHFFIPLENVHSARGDCVMTNSLYTVLQKS